MKYLALVLCLALLLPVVGSSQVVDPSAPVPIKKPLLDIWTGILDIPGNLDVITTYSVRDNAMCGGSGFGVLRFGKWVTLDAVLMRSTQSMMLGTNLSLPISRIFNDGGFVTITWPSLAKLEVGATITYGVNLIVDDYGNTKCEWVQVPLWGPSVLYRFSI